MFRLALVCILLALITQPCFASDKILKDSWTYYKSTFINQDGRVIDFKKNNITTSEGQAYALLRAVMVNDKKTFTKVYIWTKNNLKRDDNNLFAWLWGKNNENYSIIDKNSATDADIDIAFALILASKKWRKSEYLNDAKKIISDIWKYETILVNKKRILTAGYDQTQNDIVDINPSYFAPYAFRTFSRYDSNDWNSLISDNYELLDNVIKSTESKLPPNWFTINKTTGKVSIDDNSTKSDFSYDAVRVFFRIYLDSKLYKDKRANSILSNITFFTNQWKTNSTFYTNVKSNGDFRNHYEAPGSIAILLPAINIYDKNLAIDIYKSKIETTYKKTGYWGLPLNYYAQNLIWFGHKELFESKYNTRRLKQIEKRKHGFKFPFEFFNKQQRK